MIYHVYFLFCRGALIKMSIVWLCRQLCVSERVNQEDGKNVALHNSYQPLFTQNSGVGRRACILIFGSGNESSCIFSRRHKTETPFIFGHAMSSDN